MLEAATGVIAAMMTDVRRLTRQRNALSAPPPVAGLADAGAASRSGPR